MANIGSGEILVILLLALVILGPERLPDAARKVGGFVRQIKQMSSGFQHEMKRAMDYRDGDKPFHPEEARIRPLPAPGETVDGEAFETDVRGVGSEPYAAAPADDDVERPDDQRAAG